MATVSSCFPLFAVAMPFGSAFVRCVAKTAVPASNLCGSPCLRCLLSRHNRQGIGLHLVCKQVSILGRKPFPQAMGCRRRVNRLWPWPPPGAEPARLYSGCLRVDLLFGTVGSAL